MSDKHSQAAKYPPNAFSFLLDLLGKKVDHPVVQMYKKRFPYHDIVADDNRGTVVFNVKDGSR